MSKAQATVYATHCLAPTLVILSFTFCRYRIAPDATTVQRLNIMCCSRSTSYEIILKTDCKRTSFGGDVGYVQLLILRIPTRVAWQTLNAQGSRDELHRTKDCMEVKEQELETCKQQSAELEMRLATVQVSLAFTRVVHHGYSRHMLCCSTQQRDAPHIKYFL